MRMTVLAIAAALSGAAVGGIGALIWLGLPTTGHPLDLLPHQASAVMPAEEAMSRVQLVRKGETPKKGASDHRDYFTIEVGAIFRGTSQSEEFTLSNTGHAPLTLKQGYSSCKCTFSEIADSQLMPGAATTVRLTWKAEGEDGPFHHWASIETNDPTSPRITFAVNGRLSRGIEVAPHTVTLGSVNQNDPSEVEFTVLAYHRDDMQLTQLTPIDDQEAQGASVSELKEKLVFTHKPLPGNELRSSFEHAKCGHRVTLSLKPGLPLGAIQRKIRIGTNLGDATVVGLNGRIVGDVTLGHSRLWNKQTEVLLLGNVEQAKGKSDQLILTINRRKRRDVKVTVKKVLPAELQATLGEPRVDETTMNWPITIQVPPGAPIVFHAEAGAYGRVILETDHPDAPELVIPVSFLVTK